MDKYINIDTEKAKSTLTGFDEITKKMIQCIDELEQVKNSLWQGSFSEIRNILTRTADEIQKEKGYNENLRSSLEKVIHYYEVCEKKIAGQSGDKKLKIEELSSKIQSLIKKILDNLKDLFKGPEQPTNHFGADPINFATGNFVYEREYLRTGGIFPMKFLLTYNSLHEEKESGSVNCLSEGWIHNYEAKCEVTSDEARVTLAGGKVEIFLLQEDGRFVPLIGTGMNFVKLEQGYAYRSSFGMLYFFDESGKNVRIEDLNQNSLVLTYNERNLLSKISNHSGQFLAYEYDENAKLVKVSDHANRQVKLGFLDRALHTITDELDAVFTFTYDSFGYLATTTNALGVETLKNQYDESGRVLIQEYPNGGKVTLEYLDQDRIVRVTEQNGNQIDYVRDELNRNIETIYANGTTETRFNEKNQKTAVVDRLGNITEYEYDGNGDLIKVTNALKETVEMEYNNRHKVVKTSICGDVLYESIYDDNDHIVCKKDAFGNEVHVTYNQDGKPVEVIQQDLSKIVLSYDVAGNVVCITDPLGNETHYEYDNLNRISSTTDGNGNISKFFYDSKGNIVKAVNAEGLTKEYQYNKAGLMTKMTDFDGTVVTREYDENNQLAKVINKAGSVASFFYNEMFQLSKKVEPNGGEYEFNYDQFHNLCEVTNPLGSKMKYEYDANGNQTKIIDSRGNTVEFTYDALNRVSTIKDADGSLSSMEYNHLGQKTKMIDALGHVREVVYNKAGQKEKSIDVSGNETRFVYNELGLIQEKVDPVGRVTKFEYFPGGTLKKVLHPDGRFVQFTYDGNKNLLSKEDQDGYVVTYSYNCMNLVTKISSSTGQEVFMTYDELGRVLSLVDANGNETAYTYEPAGKIKTVKEANGTLTEYVYDAMGDVTDVYQVGKEEMEGVMKLNEIHQRTPFTHYERNIFGMTEKKTDALGNFEQFIYDEDGILRKYIDQDGFSKAYEYTKGGQLSSVTYEDGKTVYLSYNPLKQLTEIKDWLGITTIEVNEQGAPEKIIDPKGNETLYYRGKMGERRGLQYPDGSKVEYEYDDLLRMTKLSSKEGVFTYQYDQFGRLSEKVFPNGMKALYGYGVTGALTTLEQYLNDELLNSWTNEYDKNDNKVKVKRYRKDMPEETGEFIYQYDEMNQLSSVWKDGQCLDSYQYDGHGNRICKNHLEESIVYTYNKANQLLNRFDGTTKTEYAYDHRGNLRTVHENGSLTHQYDYNMQNRIMAAFSKDGKASKYEYNGIGLRIAESVYEYDAFVMENDMEQIEKAISPMKNVEYLLDITKVHHNLLMEKTDHNAKRFLYDDSILSMQDEETFYIFADEQGSPMDLIGSENNILEQYAFDEFGVSKNQKSDTKQPFGYVGFYRDVIADLYFVQMREYDEKTGRFTAKDSVTKHMASGFTQQDYSYCYNRPINFVDLNGAFPSWSDIENWCCNTIDTVGTGIDYVVDNYGTQINTTVTNFFNTCNEGYQYCCKEVQTGLNYALKTAGGITREVCEYNFIPGVDVDLSDIWHYVSTNTPIGHSIMNMGDFYDPDGNGIYHTNPDCWQRAFGYNDFYDGVFDSFTAMDKNKDITFRTADGTEYTLWMWKGDYYNLGAGCETGIYYGDPGQYHLTCATDTNLKMTIHMVDAEGNVIANWSPEDDQWWITSFNSNYQDYTQAQIDGCVVTGTIDFSGNPELFKAFCESYSLQNGSKIEYLCIDSENMIVTYRW